MQRLTDWDDPRLSRRRFLAAGGAALTASGLLAACGGGGAATTAAGPQQQDAGTPRRGGRLRVGMLGSGRTETYNPARAASPIDALHMMCVYDHLVRVAPDYKTEPGLAVGWEHNRDATVWEVSLRKDVVWHDGKPFTADDVIYSLRAMADLAHHGYSSVANVRVRDLAKRGQHIVQVPLKQPDARLFDYFTAALFMTAIVQDGAKDFSRPVGTGPFKLQSFTPGRQSVLVANSDYWESGKPYLDELRITSIDDDTARVNALVDRQVDVCSPLPFARAKAPGPGIEPLVGAPGGPHYFYMRCDQAPFDDVRVRQAMKLIADRQGLIDAAFSGYGAVGNDIAGKGLPFYDASLPQRVQDLEQARSLLKAAGRSDLRVTLQTSPFIGGIVEAATVFAQQAAEAGVTIRVERELPSAYFDPSVLYLKMAFAQDLVPVSSLAQWYVNALKADGAQNLSHWRNARSDALFARARAATDDAESQRLWNEIQRMQYDEGGNLIWCASQTVDGLGPNVAGIGGKGTGWAFPLGDFQVRDWGLAA